MKKKIIILSLFICVLIGVFVFNHINYRRGCCSWHNGVCGCADNGRIICCDGTYSPSCRCR